MRQAGVVGKSGRLGFEAPGFGFRGVMQGAAERRRPRPVGQPHVAVDRAGNRRRLAAAPADRCAQVGVVRVRRIGAARGRQAVVVDRRTVDAALAHDQVKLAAPRRLPVVGGRGVQQDHRREPLGRVRLVAQGQVVGRPVEDAPLNRVGRSAGRAAVLNVHAVAVGDEIGLAFLHAEDLGLVAGGVRRQPFDVHRELAGADGLRERVLDEALAGIRS